MHASEFLSSSSNLLGSVLRRWGLVALGVLPLLTAACGTERPADPVEGESQELGERCSRGTTLTGIDVSQYQGDVDFRSVRSDKNRFAFARAANGSTRADSEFAANWQKMKEAGLVRGAYQYFVASEDGARQANFLMDVIDRAGGLQPDDLPPVIDLESAGDVLPSELTTKVGAWVATIQERAGRKPIIYTNKHWQEQLGNPSSQGLPLWVADYTTNRCPQVPSAWNTWAFWQHSDKGSVTGVRTTVSLSRFNGTEADLQALIARSRTTED